MKNRLVSLFQLDDLLTATPNGHNGKGTKGHARKKRCRKGGLQATSPKAAPGISTPSAPAPTTAPVAQSFDTGGAIHCDHAIAYPAAPKVELPTDDAGTTPAPHAQALGIEVEAFEDDGDDTPTVTLSPDEDYPQAESDSVEEVYTPSVDRVDVEAPRMEVSEEAASFTAQMAAVESDLAELAERVQHPPPNSTPPTPPSDEEAAPAPGTSQASSKSHAIFDTMAKGMNYATEFRLPSLQLSQVFSVLDRQLDAESVNAAPTPDATPAPVAMPGGDVLIADLVKLAPQPAVQTPTPAQSLGGAINVRHQVQLVAQQTGYSCWAAGAAMVVGWRDHMSIDPSEIARATGYWAQYQTGLNAEDTHMFNVFRLTAEPAQTYTVQGFADLVKSHGPLWVASAEPGPHVRVVTGMVGDGTPTGTVVYINDPWEAGMNVFHLPNRGAQYTETYQRFVEKQETLGRQEIKQQGIYVAHA